MPPVKRILEAILFVADEPVPVKKLAEIVGEDEAAVEQALKDVAADLSREKRGFRLRQVGGGYRLFTDPKSAAYVEKYVLSADFRRLSQAALETVAVIAYKQPITRSEVSQIRGVNVESVMNNLIAKGLIEEVGKDEGPGHPILYGTTRHFLESFGLNAIEDLPPLGGFEPDEETKRKIRRKLQAEK